MAAQMKQLEQRLMALRLELREKENKARQAEGSVQDLKLQLDDLQVCKLAVVPVMTQSRQKEGVLPMLTKTVEYAQRILYLSEV